MTSKPAALIPRCGTKGAAQPLCIVIPRPPRRTGDLLLDSLSKFSADVTNRCCGTVSHFGLFGY